MKCVLCRKEKEVDDIGRCKECREEVNEMIEKAKVNSNIIKKEVKKMSTLKETAKEYTPQSTTQNIADLEKVSVDLILEDDTFEFTDKVTKEQKTVTQKVIILEGEKYRVPVSVIQQLKVLIEDNSDMKYFKVKKTGNNKDNTSYQVIPVLE